MNQSLNLTPERGPSVWNDARTSHSYFHSAMVTGGSMLTAYALRSRSRNSAWLAGLGMGAIAYGLFASGSSFGAGARMTNVMNRMRPQRHADLDEIDLASKQSFPASDPPPMR